MNLDKILNQKFIFLDGAMGTMLQKKGLRTGEIPENYNITHSDIVYDIHKQYVDAGADIITTNTFGANELKLKQTPYTLDEIIYKAVTIAKEASSGNLVALDIGPIGQLLSPLGELSFNDAYNIFKAQIEVGKKAGADLVLIETMTDIYEAKAAILAAKENCSLPVFCTMTFEENMRTLTGTDPITMVQILQGLNVDALGVNCSLGPKEIQPIVDELIKYSSIPIITQPNAGIPDFINGGTYNISPEVFSEEIKIMALKGVSIVGGCCGTSPEYIKLIKNKLEVFKPKENDTKKITCACSSTKTEIIGDEVKIIGEKINPNGKKNIKKALMDHDLDYIVSEAINQKEAGADILDINVGLPQINRKQMMIDIIKKFNGIIDIPLQIDSTKPEVIESAVRLYNGKPIINSVSGKKASMEKIFPIVKKYGACVIGLTLDDEGIPSSVEKRIEIAEKIINTAKSYGIPKENIMIDCLVLTVSAQQNTVMDTLKAISEIKSRLGVKTVLGASNISFGLPNRTLINSTYLVMALTYGLDTPITDPTSKSIMDAIRAFRVLVNKDIGCKDYISYYKDDYNNEKLYTPDTNRNLKQIIINGFKNEAYLETKNLLLNTEPMDIINSILIPVLDEVGEEYEKGEVFLPELIRCAETVKMSFKAIKENLLLKDKENNQQIYKGKILLATVKGDIHDIGKNIVKTLLDNYGFEVFDLGKDVSSEKILDTIKKNDIKLIGLSALMTTTVNNMQSTIKEVKLQMPNCRIMVGGAVLNEEYAKKIGADFYGKDAREAVNIAKRIFCNTKTPY